MSLFGPPPGGGTVSGPAGSGPSGRDGGSSTFDLFEPASAPGPDRDWRDYFHALRRRIWPASAAFLLAVVAAVVHTYTRVPLYEARTRLLIEVDLAELAGLKDPLAQGRLLNAQQMPAMILQSRSLARRTLKALGQWPTSDAGSDPGAAGDAGATPVVMAFERPEEAAAIDGFLSGLRISQPPGALFVEVSYVAIDPLVSARHVNTHVQEFIEQHVERKANASKELTDWLNARLVDQRKVLEASEAALEAYRREHGVTRPIEQPGDVRRFAELSDEFTKAKAERIAKEAVMTQLLASLNNGVDPADLPSPPEYQSLHEAQSEYIVLQRRYAQLAEKLGELHPELIAARNAVEVSTERLRREVGRVVESVRSEYSAALATEQKLSAAVNAQRAEAQTLNRTDVQLAVLQRDAESNREIYENLQQRVNEYGVMRGQQGSNIRILDPAEIPRQASNLSPHRDLRYGLLGGLMLALCVAFLLEHLDNAIKTPEQVARMGVPFLGLVPLVRSRQSDHLPQMMESHAPVFSEAIRALRTNIRLSIAGDRMRSIVVTSANAGEGKTVVANNLATALALAGQRVLLIDTDLRRPRLHRIFSIDQEPGLSDFLVGDAKWTDVVRRVPYDVDVVTSGSRAPNPSELLDSSTLRSLLESLRTQYDWVILDAPPIMPVTDSVVLADMVSGVLMVAAAEVTPVPLLRSALAQLARTRATKMGVVLNKVDLDRRRYYYTRHYRPDYRQYQIRRTA